MYLILVSGVSIFHFYATGLMFKIGSWTTYGMLFLAKDRQYNTNVKVHTTFLES